MAVAKLPLAGIRVLDLTQLWAGPHAIKLLGDMGAQVIKVESRTRYDPSRGPIDRTDAEVLEPAGVGTMPFNQSAWYHQNHRNQLGITLDLVSPVGVALVKRLAAVSDVVADNFRKGTLRRMGLDYEALKAVRPDIIALSMPGFGLSGPWSSFAAYGVTMEGLVGLYALTGYPDAGPLKSGGNIPDPLNAVHAAGAILSALWYRRRTGKGQLIDFSHHESLGSLLGDRYMEYSMNGRNSPRLGNRHTSKSPQGCYRCLGEDCWIAISVASDAEWARLCQVMGQPELAHDVRFADCTARWQNQDALDQIVDGWTSQFEHYDLMRELQSKGIMAAAVADTAEVCRDPQLGERNFFEPVLRPGTGRLAALPGMVWKLSKTPGSIRTPAPLLGEHNAIVLGDILGLPSSEIEGLEQAGIIGTMPAEGADESAF